MVCVQQANNFLLSLVSLYDANPKGPFTFATFVGDNVSNSASDNNS
jgi:hypothetical protein